MFKLKLLDGQYLASRLSRSISAQSSLLKKLLARYNSLSCVMPADHLTWTHATDLSLEQCVRGSLDCDTRVPKKVKFEAIKHHHLLLRCDEELKMLCDEMKSCLAFYHEDWKQLTSAVQKLLNEPCTKYKNGALALLQLARLKCEKKLTTLVSSFSPYIDIDPLPVDQFLLSDDLHDNTGTCFPFHISLHHCCTLLILFPQHLQCKIVVRISILVMRADAAGKMNLIVMIVSVCLGYANSSSHGRGYSMNTHTLWSGLTKK